MKNLKYLLAAAAAAFLVAAPVAGCTKDEKGGNGTVESGQFLTVPGEEEGFSPGNAQSQKPQTVSYIRVLSDGVNIRSGAGTDHSVRGSAEKETLYCLSGAEGGWYKTGYRNKTGYISAEYCAVTALESSSDAEIEAVIAEGAKLLGTPYVYGATRYHDGSGKLLKGFNDGEFDCSSLMQYIFYKGAGKILQVNTRTQILQGEKVAADELRRGDLMFFTNAQRRYNAGVERVGHVGLYLGGNYILHTASDYAKIEQISSQRWSYFIEGRRLIG